MKLTTYDIASLQAALSASRIIGTDLAVLAGGKIMGVNDKRDAAIISDLDLSCPDEVKIGIGRVDELTKRLALFGEAVEGELKLNDRNEVTQITLTSGRTKVQFRCTSMSLLERKYPQENADVEAVKVFFSKEEIGQLSRGARTFSAESIVIKVDRDCTVHIECTDSNNDRFAQVLEKPATFTNREAESTVFVYRADVLTALLSDAGKDYDTFAVAIGEGGSLTGRVRGHTLIIMPQANGE